MARRRSGGPSTTAGSADGSQRGSQSGAANGPIGAATGAGLLPWQSYETPVPRCPATTYITPLSSHPETCHHHPPDCCRLEKVPGRQAGDRRSQIARLYCNLRPVCRSRPNVGRRDTHNARRCGESPDSPDTRSVAGDRYQTALCSCVSRLVLTVTGSRIIPGCRRADRSGHARCVRRRFDNIERSTPIVRPQPGSPIMVPGHC